MKYFTVYKDLIVRECLESATDNNVDLIGIIEGRETIKFFHPNYFSKTKAGSTVQLWEWKIIDDCISINKFFKISKIIEQPDSKLSRSYYKEIVIIIADVFDKTIKFPFHIEPTAVLSYTDLQKFIKEIIEKIESSESVGMYELLRTCKERESMIEKLESKCMRLDQDNLDLLTRIEEFTSKDNL